MKKRNTRMCNSAATPDLTGCPRFGANKYLLALLVALGWAAFAYQIVFFLIITPPIPPEAGIINTDFWVYRNALVEFVHGRGLHFAYPVFSAMIFFFIGWLPERTAEIVWGGLMRVSVIAGFLLIIFHCQPRPPANGASRDKPGLLDFDLAQYLVSRWRWLGIFIAIAFTPAFRDVHYGNMQSFVFFLLCLLCVMVARGREKTAGVALGMLCLIKITPVVLIPAFFFARQFRLLAVSGLFFCAYLLVLLSTGWWRWDLYFFQNTMPNVAFEWQRVSFSLTMFVGNVFQPEILNNKAAFDSVSRIISFGVLGWVCLTSLLAGRRARPNGGNETDAYDGRAALSAGCFAIVLISPLLETHHLSASIPAWVFLFHDYLERRRGHAYFCACLAFWAICLGHRAWCDLQGYDVFQVLFPGKNVSPFYYGTFSLLFLWLITSIRQMYRRREEP